MRRKRIQILNTYIDVMNTNETVEEVKKYLKMQRPLHLMGVNADKINMLNKNDRLKQIVNGCGIINADGASVVIASRYLGTPLPERVAGIDLMGKLLDIAEKEGYSIFLLGAREDIVRKTAYELKKKYTNLKIAGIRNGYLKNEQWREVANMIRKSEAQIVFVGISSPLKEYLVDYFIESEKINSVFMGVGGSFDVLSGEIKRAPFWMQKCNLEWFFRWMQEPRRLFKRYFVGNIKFIVDVCKEKRRKKNKNESVDGRCR